MEISIQICTYENLTKYLYQYICKICIYMSRLVGWCLGL